MRTRISARAPGLGALAAAVLLAAAPLAATAGPVVGTPTRARAASARATRPAVVRPIGPPMHSVAALDRYIERKKTDARQRAEAEMAAGQRERPRGGAKAQDEAEEAGVDWLEAKLWYLRQRAYPYDRVDWSAYRRAEQHRARMRPYGGGVARPGLLATGPQQPPGSTPAWEFVGPNNLDIPYTVYYGLRPLSGRVNAVAYATDNGGSTYDVYYAAGCTGGVWKSTDRGQSWTPLSDGWPNLLVSAIAVDPTNNNILYVGTGDFHGYGGYSNGLMRSLDGGRTWRTLGLAEFGTTPISAVVVDTERPNVVTVSTGRGSTLANVWRSTDRGITWRQAFSAQGDWHNVISCESFTGAARAYAAIGSVLNDTTWSTEIWTSRDGGETWAKATSPVSSNQVSSDIASSKLYPGVLYAMYGSDQKIYRSTDFGANWKEITKGFPGGYNWSQSFYDYHINATTETSVGYADVLYIGLIDLVNSPLAMVGDEVPWQSVGGPSYTDNSILHNDQHSMAFNPRDPGEALVGHDGGVYRFHYDWGSNTWWYDYEINKRIGITQFYAAAFHPTDRNVMLGGTQDNATPMCSGDTDNWNNVGGGDGGFCAINPQNPSIQYATSQALNIYRTGDGWSTSEGITPPSSFGDPRGFIAPIALDSKNPRYLYAGTNYLYRWDENTRTWTSRLGYRRLSLSGVVSFIAVAPSDSNTIYTGSSNGEVFVTRNAGDTWTQINRGGTIPTTLPMRTITSIVVHPTNPSYVLVGLSGTGTAHLWRCVDTTRPSRAWTSVSGAGYAGLPDIPVDTVCVDPSAPDRVWYVGTDIGVFNTQDGGGIWADMTQPLGLPNVQVNTLAAVPGTGYLNAATFGRGMWRIPLVSVPAGVPLRSVNLVPNPVRGGELVQGIPTSRTSVTCTVILAAPAPQGGQKVDLSSSDASLLNLPASVTVPGGYATKVFTFTANEVSTRTDVVVTAKSGNSTGKATLGVLPLPLVSLSLSKTTVSNGGTVTGTVTLRDPAPFGGAYVTLFSSVPPAAMVPSRVLVKPGNRTADFTVTARRGANATTTISASFNGVTRRATLRVTP